MASEPATTSGTTVGMAVEKTLVSLVRFSSAATLYGLQQLEMAAGSFQDTERLSQQVNQMEAAVNSATECLAERISESKQGALKSFTGMAEQVVSQSFAALGLADPRQIFRLTNRLAQKSSEAILHWTRKPEPAPAEEPKLAVDVLAS